MSLDRKTIKKIGKDNMRKQWGELLLALVLFDVGIIVAALFTFGVGGFVVVGPLMYGLIYMYYRSTQDEKVNQKMLMKGFKEKFGESFLAGLLLDLILAIPVLISLVLMAIRMGSIVSIMDMGVSTGMGTGMPVDYGGGGGTAFTVISFILWLVAIVVCLYIFYGIAMTIYILVREPKKTAVQAIKKSWAMTKGQKLRLFIFDLSYIGWFILAGLTFGILLIWVLPYYMSARIVLFNDIYDNSTVADDPEFEFKSEFSDVKGSVGGLVNKAKPAGKKAEEESKQATEGTSDSKDTEGEYKTCSNCGAKVKAKAKFCNKCGSPM